MPVTISVLKKEQFQAPIACDALRMACAGVRFAALLSCWTMQLWTRTRRNGCVKVASSLTWHPEHMSLCHIKIFCCIPLQWGASRTVKSRAFPVVGNLCLGTALLDRRWGVRLKTGKPGFDPCLRHGTFSRSCHTSDWNIGTGLAALSGAWRCRVSTGTGLPSVSALGLGESWICNFYLSMAARTIVWVDVSLRHTSLLPGRWATNR